MYGTNTAFGAIAESSVPNAVSVPFIVLNRPINGRDGLDCITATRNAKTAACVDNRTTALGALEDMFSIYLT